MSFDLFAYKELQDTAADCEDRYDQLERMMKFVIEERRNVLSGNSRRDL